MTTEPANNVTAEKQDDFIDLDELAPKPLRIKIDGKVIEARPPELEELLHLGQLGKDLGASAGEDGTGLDTEKVRQLRALIDTLAPGLEGRSLNPFQLLGVVTAISKMAMPKDAKELEKRGITPATPKPSQPE